MTIPTRPDWMLYGAYGTTGRVILDEALRRGHRPILAGRDGAQLSALGQGPACVRRGCRSMTTRRCGQRSPA
jgi:short subunit dehydrogenase-like uncharacterized protein